MKKYDVICAGEALIDFTDIGVSENGMKIFEQNPGGAPANVACVCARLGLDTSFLGKVGDDMHGDFIIDTIKKCGVDTSCMVKDKTAFTTLAFVSLDKNGNRSFSFARKHSADINLCEEDIDFEALKNTKIFHFGSLSLTNEPSKSAILKCIKTARENGAVISYDPNYRPLLWESENKAKEGMRSVLEMADVIKISDEEAELVCDTADIKEAAKVLHGKGIKLVIITLGAQGSFISCEEGNATIPCEKVKVVDTTGAGDSFLGGFLYKLVKENGANTEITLATAKEFAKFANKVAAYCVARRGAIPKDIMVIN